MPTVAPRPIQVGMVYLFAEDLQRAFSESCISRISFYFNIECPLHEGSNCDNGSYGFWSKGKSPTPPATTNVKKSWFSDNALHSLVFSHFCFIDAIIVRSI